jgi:hypothetical protein
MGLASIFPHWYSDIAIVAAFPGMPLGQLEIVSIRMVLPLVSGLDCPQGWWQKHRISHRISFSSDFMLP